MDSQENALANGNAATQVEEVQNQEQVKVETPTVEETPVEETPAEEVTVEETPAVEEAPAVEAAPAEETPAAVKAPIEDETPAAVGDTPAVDEAPAEETPAAVEAPAEDETPAEEAPAPEVNERKVYQTKAEVLDRVKEIAHGEEPPRKDEIDYLKTVFYKLHIAEREASLKEYLDRGGDPETYQVTPDNDEEVFKAEMGIIKERRQQLFREQEAEKEDNLKRKLAIIEKIKAMITSPEEASKTYQEFKALQQEWREIKSVPAEKANELWRNYQLYVEQFYDLLKLNSEARELDFKKNLEVKTRLCEAAERLADEPDVISAFFQLQKLHAEYRETGPVGKEQREEIWQRFKAASTVINKRHQAHFEAQRAREEENLSRKTELCEKVEAIIAAEHKNSSDWDRQTQEVIALQQEWKTIGYAPQKMNVKIFERFRGACDQFFAAKADFFRTQRENYKVNIEKKRALIEKVKELKDSTEWRSTSDKIIALQKEWKTIGVVPRKIGDQLWEEFLGYCNQFFEARKAVGAGQRGEEHKNLEMKRDIIARLKLVTEEAGDNVQEMVQKLVEDFNAIGHVPYKEKDKLFDEYHSVLDKLYKELNISVAKRRLNNFKQSLKQVAERGEGALDSERARLMRQYETLKQEIQTYENNLGFLSVSSKKGNSLIDEMNRKVQKLKDDLQLVREKIKAIDAENSNKEQ